MHTIRISITFLFVVLFYSSVLSHYGQWPLANTFTSSPAPLPAKHPNHIPAINKNQGSTPDVVNSIYNVTLESFTFCGGESLPVNFTTQGIFSDDNIFLVQLSDATGSFTSPEMIGKGTSSPIIASLPPHITTGRAYRIRVTATSPLVNGDDNGKDITIFSKPLPPEIDSNTYCGWGVVGGTLRIYTGEPPLGQTFRWYATATSSNPIPGQQGNQFITPFLTEDTTFYASLVNENGCESERQAVHVDMVLSPKVVQGPNEKVCINKPAFTLSGFAPTDGIWSGKGVTATGIFDPAIAGIGKHTLKIEYRNGPCGSWNFKEVEVLPSPVLVAAAVDNGCTTATGIKNLVPFTASFTNTSQYASSYFWEFGDGSTSTLKAPSHTFKKAGQYDVYLTIVANGGCRERRFITTVEAEESQSIPNVITPNGDNLNETFVVNVTCFPAHLKVFNRWGNVIYDKANYQNDWNDDGQPAGIYFYQLQASNGQSWKGWVEIIR